MSYDQWKTASPFDDEPDITEELQRAKRIMLSWPLPLDERDRDTVINIIDAAMEWIDNQ